MKILGLAAVAAAAVMAFAGSGSASATILTCTEPANVKVQCPKGTVLDASVEGGTIKLTGTQTITCAVGTVQGKLENSGGSTETVSGQTGVNTIIEGKEVVGPGVTFDISFCNNCTNIQVTNGTLEIHTENNGTTANGNGTLTGSGFTALLDCSGVTCYYVTGNGKDMGTLTGSSNTGATATIDIDATLQKQAGSSFLCTNTATWEGSYTITSPDWLDVD